MTKIKYFYHYIMYELYFKLFRRTVLKLYKPVNMNDIKYDKYIKLSERYRKKELEHFDAYFRLIKLVFKT